MAQRPIVEYRFPEYNGQIKFFILRKGEHMPDNIHCERGFVGPSAVIRQLHQDGSLESIEYDIDDSRFFMALTRCRDSVGKGAEETFNE